MVDFLWHEVTDKEKDQIKKQAKSIMNSFSSKLAKLNLKTDSSNVEREEFERVEGEGNEGSSEFRKRMFDNAKNKNDDFIISEKGDFT